VRTPSGMTSSSDIYAEIVTLIEPFNKKAISLGPATSFANDLELDSLTVMDLVANIEDHFDINLSLNLLPDLETIQHLSDAVARIVAEK
jgi:acyl carrier protein